MTSRKSSLSDAISDKKRWYKKSCTLVGRSKEGFTGTVLEPRVLTTVMQIIGAGAFTSSLEGLGKNSVILGCPAVSATAGSALIAPSPSSSPGSGFGWGCS